MNCQEHNNHIYAESLARYLNKWKQPCRTCYMYDKPLFITQMSVQQCYECTLEFLRKNKGKASGELEPERK